MGRRKSSKSEMWSRKSATSSAMLAVFIDMSCVVAAICVVMACILGIVSMLTCMSLACCSMLAIESCWYFSVIFVVTDCMPMMNGIVVCLMGFPSGRVIVCT